MSAKSFSVISAMTYLTCLRYYVRQIGRWSGQIATFSVTKLFNASNYLSELPKILLALLELGRL